MLQNLPCRKSGNSGVKVNNFTFCFHFLMKSQEKLVIRWVSDEVNDFLSRKQDDALIY